MLSFRYRFHGHGSLKWVYSRGKSVRSKHLVVKYSFHPRRPLPRVSVVISKKIFKKAVPRNRVRRRLYEQFRARLDQLKPGSDVVCIVTSPEVKDMPAHELATLIDELLKEAKLYKNN